MTMINETQRLLAFLGSAERQYLQPGKTNTDVQMSH